MSTSDSDEVDGTVLNVKCIQSSQVCFAIILLAFVMKSHFLLHTVYFHLRGNPISSPQLF